MNLVKIRWRDGIKALTSNIICLSDTMPTLSSSKAVSTIIRLLLSRQTEKKKFRLAENMNLNQWTLDNANLSMKMMVVQQFPALKKVKSSL